MAIMFAKGFVQRKGVDYLEVFQTVAWFSNILLFLMPYECHNWYRRATLDIKLEILDVTLDEEILVEQSRGYENRCSEQLMYTFSKARYGLKMTSRERWRMLREFLI